MIADYRDVVFEDGFWKEKEKLNTEVTLGAVYDRFAETGRIAAFRCDWKEGMPGKPHFFWDSDVAKWMEAAAYQLRKKPDAALEAKVEALIDEIERNADEHGYFNIYFTVIEPKARFTDRNKHELYCAGHLMEAACAYYEATGRDRFLHCMEKYADYIAEVFMREKSAAFVTPGHEEIELALYRLYKTTGKKQYLDLCAFFLENRGAEGKPETPIGGTQFYAQSHAPIRKQREAYGHAVRAMYLYSAMADYAAETKDEALLDTCRALFRDVTERKMYVTGGLGSTRRGEAFTAAYDLPNETAYAETCASIAMIFFAHRMFLADPENGGKYEDVVELELYNGALSGLSLSGDSFFYENPLEINRAQRHRFTACQEQEPWSITQRVKVFGCSCCPPNLTRLLGSLGQYFYAYDEKRNVIVINQFASGSFSCNGAEVRVTTDYPRSGEITVESNVVVEMRVPGWCKKVNGDGVFARLLGGYIRFNAGVNHFSFDMTPTLLTAHPAVYEDSGKAALRRGPIVYCAEETDNAALSSLLFDTRRVAETVLTPDPSIGAPTLTVPGFVRSDTEGLYASFPLSLTPSSVRMIPYYAFANRGESDMKVWMPFV